MKKLISTISALALCASIIPGTVMAANGADYSTDFGDFVNGGTEFSSWTFNGASTPWFSSSTFCEDAATSVVADTDAENANLKLVPSGGNLAGAIYDAGITSGVYKVSFRLKKSDAAAVRVRLTDTIGETASEALYITPYENITGPNGKAININQKGDTVHVTADEWSNFEFIVNQNTKKILRFADGRGILSTDTAALDNIEKILICASDGDVWIDDFSVTKLTDEAAYGNSDVWYELFNTNFTEYINHAFNVNTANNNDNLTLGNAAWRGGAYTVLTDRGVSMKLTRTSYSTAANDLYFTLPTGISAGVVVTEVYIKPVTTDGVSDVAAMKIELCGTATKRLTTDASGKVTAFATPKDKTGIDLKLNIDEWNKIELVNDLNNDVVYAFVNGYGCGSIVNGSTTFTGVNVIASNNNACDVYVDDLRVYVDEDSLYNAPDKTGYIENENFTAAAAKVSNASNPTTMNFNNFTFGNAAWKGSVHATKTDKGISLCIGDPTGNTIANKWNDVTWKPTEALAGTDGKYVIEFDEYYDDAVTCKMIIDVNGSTSGQKTEFAVSDDGGVVSGNIKAKFISGQWNHAKITVDLKAKTAVFNINGIDAKTVKDIANTDIKEFFIQTAKSGGGNHGDIIIDDFTVKYVMPMVIEKTATGAAVTFSADSNVQTIIASYDVNGVLLGTNISDTSTNGKVEIQRTEGVKQYKAFMWESWDNLRPIIECVSLK